MKLSQTDQDTLDYVFSAILGAGFSSVVFWTLSKAFLVGIAGALGGLFARWIVKVVKKKFFTKNEEDVN